MFPFIFSPSKVSQPLLQPHKTNFISCDENVTRVCQKVLEHVAFAVPRGLLPYCIFQYFPRKNNLAIILCLFLLSPFKDKDDVFYFGLPEVYFLDSLTSQRLLLMFWHEFCQTVTKCWELMSFGSLFWEGGWRGLESVLVQPLLDSFNFSSSPFSSKRNLNLPGAK